MTTSTRTKTNGTRPATTLDLDVDDLSLGDCIDVEEITGEPAFVTFAAAQTGQMTAKAMAALVWVSKRKADPTFTFEDAKQIKVASLSTEDDAGQTQG
jgi:hypothetical protein